MGNKNLTAIPFKFNEDFTPQEKEMLNQKLVNLLAYTTERYTMNESSSVTVETAEELLKSVCYTLSQSFENRTFKKEQILNGDFKEFFNMGTEITQRKKSSALKLWNTACTTLPKIENIYLFHTLKSIGASFSKYDVKFHSHIFPCSIDYYLCSPVPEDIMGIDYIIAYLKNIIRENAIINKFPEDSCKRLLFVNCHDYKNLPVNLCEPIIINSLGLSIAKEDISKLSCSKDINNRLFDIFRSLTKSQMREYIKDESKRLCGKLKIYDDDTVYYCFLTCEQIIPRILLSDDENKLNNIFLSF